PVGGLAGRPPRLFPADLAPAVCALDEIGRGGAAGSKRVAPQAWDRAPAGSPAGRLWRRGCRRLAHVSNFRRDVVPCGESPRSHSTFHSGPMRTIWNGSVSFGLVTIPVGLAPATTPKARSSDVSFRTLHRECKTPI